MKYKSFGKIHVNLDFHISYNGILGSISSVREAFVRLWRRISAALSQAYHAGMRILARHFLSGRELRTTYTPSVAAVGAQTVSVLLSVEEVRLVHRLVAANGDLEVITINDAGVSSA